MRTRTTSTASARRAAAAALGLGAGLGALACAAADIELSALPPHLLRTAPANLMLTVDNAASMAAAFSPSSLAPHPGSAALTSPDVNRLYYDPWRTYRPGLGSDGRSLGDADFHAALLYPYLGTGCLGAAPIDLGLVYRVAHHDPPASDCTSGGRASPALAPTGGPAFYHLYDPENYYDASGAEPSADCNARRPYPPTGPAATSCRRCGDDIAAPRADTPDQCFDRIIVGSAADSAVARCADLPPSSANPSGLKLRGRYPGGDCMPRATAAAAGDASAADKTNFANWLVYHRSRLLRGKTLLTHLLHALPAHTRIAYQTTDTVGLDSAGDGHGTLSSRFATLADVKPDLFDWLFALQPDGAGQLQRAYGRAGEFAASQLAQADDIALYRDRPKLAAALSCGVGCRRNLHLVVSDGEWQDGPVRGLASDDDGRGAALPKNAFGVARYDPASDVARTYADANAGMLADVAFRFWHRDLLPEEPNRVPPRMTVPAGARSTDAGFWHPGNNPATWQHLSLYAVGFGGGAVEPLPGWPFGRYAAGAHTERTIAEHGFPRIDAAVYVDAPGVGTTAAAEVPAAARADDLYHAVLNARGRYADTSRAEYLVSQLTAVVEEVRVLEERQAVVGPLVPSRTELDKDTIVFGSLLDARTWHGDLLAFRLSQGRGLQPCPDRSRGLPCGYPERPLWRASERLPEAHERVIFTSAAGEPAAFRPDLFGRLSKTQQRGLLGCGPDLPYIGDFAFCRVQPSLPADDHRSALARTRIAYLRGDRSAERGGPEARPGAGPAPDGMDDRDADDRLRTRVGPLGDIVNSKPLVVGPPSGRYRDSDYAAFRARHAERSTMVYVGANDGMLHAFSAATGAEEFAYVPQAVYARLAELTDPGYGDATPKRAFVDGNMAAADVRITDRQGRTAWRTVLIGTLGLGAQGVFALDITRPTGLREADADDVVLWELTDASTGRGGLDGRDMGFSSAPPVIVRVDDNLDDGNPPRWVALVANGYNNTHTDLNRDIRGDCDDADASSACTVSQTGAAVLYVLNIGGGDATRILAKLDTGAGVDHPLSRGRTNGLGPVTAVDVDGDLIADQAYAGDLLGHLWRFDLTDMSRPPALMFRARDADGNPQPITSRIVYRRHPTGIGALLLFGTGRYLGAGDTSDRSVHTFYGIWDDNGELGGTPGHYRPPTRAELLPQSFLRATVGRTGGGGIDTRSDLPDPRGRVSTARSADWRAGGHRGWRIDLLTEGARPAGERVIGAPRVSDGRVLFASIVPGDCCEGGEGAWITVLNADDGSRPSVSPLGTEIGGDGATATILSSIRTPDGHAAGVHGVPAVMSLGDGVMQMLVTGDGGEVARLLEETGTGSWRNWRQLR